MDRQVASVTTPRRLPPAWAACLAVLVLVLGALGSARALGIGQAPPAEGEGHPIDWRGWKLRWSVRPREGLVLSAVSFRGRQVLKHAALAEIFVPYAPGQPRPEDSLDGMGINLAELNPGRDCLPGTVCQMLNAEGRPEGKRVVAIHEESTGPVYMGELGRAYGRMLVLWCSSRLGGYTYFIRWKLRDDGVIMPDVGLTGALEHTRPAGPAEFGRVVARTRDGQVWAPTHVHNFYYRLDFDIDGPAGDHVEELNYRQDVPNRSESFRSAWTVLPRETSRSLDSAAFRSWRVVDRASINRQGHPRSYELHPGGNGVFRGSAEEAFTRADLWAARYRPTEFPLTRSDPRTVKQALAGYVDGEDLNGQDVVLWYAMHVFHYPRAEDYPAMPVVWAGFQIMPRDFLDESPLVVEK